MKASVPPKLRALAATAALLCGAFIPRADAEIVKTAALDCGKSQICFYWWPKLPTISGWHTDQAANMSQGGNGINSLVPDGFTFANADAIMYANAIYKPRYEARNPKSKSLKAVIEDDQATFSRLGASIAEAAALATADGQTLISFTYFRPGDGTWERVSYGEEDDYYLLFALSAHSEAAYHRALPVYEDMIRRYRR